jgi:hypothetical protein
VIQGSPGDLSPAVTDTGWRLIGAPSGSQSANEILGSLLADTTHQYDEIDSYAGGDSRYCAYCDAVTGYGVSPADFNLEPGHGYAV